VVEDGDNSRDSSEGRMRLAETDAGRIKDETEGFQTFMLLVAATSALSFFMRNS
jgi:hypothetical protein